MSLSKHASFFSIGYIKDGMRAEEEAASLVYPLTAHHLHVFIISLMRVIWRAVVHLFLSKAFHKGSSRNCYLTASAICQG